MKLAKLSPPHAKFRRLLAVAFTSKMVAALLPLLPWLVFVIALLVTFIQWRTEQERAQQQLQLHFSGRTQDMLENMDTRAKSYEDLLRNLQALFSWKDVEAQQFSNYVKALEIKKRYPGVHTISFAMYITEPEKAAHEQWMRAHGYPRYQITPLGPRPVFAPLIFIESFESEDTYAVGLDSMLVPEIEHARGLSQQTADVAVSAKIILPGKDEKIGFAMNLPIYVQNKAGASPDNLYGWIEASFQMDAFMQNVFGEIGQEIAVQVYDGQQTHSQNLMYDSHPTRLVHEANLRLEQRIQVGGRPWTVILTALPAFNHQLDTLRPNLILQSGILMSCMLLLTTWLLVRGQARARNAANLLAQELHARKEVESGLIESENRLQEIIDMLPIALYVKDPQSRFVLMNRASEAQFGTTSRALVGNDGAHFFPAQQMRECLTVDTQVFAQTQVVDFDEVVWHAGLAENRSVHTYKKPVFDASGNAQYLLCMTVDITERTRTEEWLRLLEHCVACLNDVIFITEPLPNWEHWPKIIFVNDAFEKQTGYTRIDAIGNTSEILRGPNTQVSELRRISQAMLEWRAIRSEIINYHKDGTEIWMEMELVPIADAKGQYKYWVTVARNINERKQAEQALRASEAMHRAIIDHAPLPMLVSDMENNRVVFSNQRCTTMFAVDEAKTDHQAVSHLVEDYFVSPSRGGELAQEVRHLGYVNDVEVMLKDCNGREFWAMISMVQSRYEGRDSIISSMVDISAIKNIQAQLREAREKADSANSAKSAFLSNMSHEIRTPMNSILGMTYLALATTLDAKQRDYLEKIHLSGQHLLALIDDILDFSKIEAGMFSIEEIPFNLPETINKLMDLMSQRIRAKGLAMHLELDATLAPNYCGDPLRISQVLINLLGNALKFTEQGQITLQVRMQTNPEGQPQVYFAVKDTGIGLTEQQQALLFKAFQQADVSSSRKYGGTGLGLAISRQLVELMQGEIGVYSQVDAGSTFWFALPLKIHQPALAPSASAPTMPVAELIAHARQKLSGCCVLLAEDTPLNQQVAMELLQSVGIEVVIANDGKEALAQLQQRSFDCVLMDVQMPGMDGLEATRVIRANPALASHIIIAMTANASAQDRSQCLASGMQDFISKPIKPALLYSTLSKWMESPASPSALTDAASLSQAFVNYADDAELINFPAGSIDLTPLTDLIGHEPALIQKFVLMFFDSADAQMAQIAACLQIALQDSVANSFSPNSQSQLQRLLQSLRSEACAMGAQEFGALCHSMEKALHDASRTSKKFNHLQQLLAQVKNQMQSQIHLVQPHAANSLAPNSLAPNSLASTAQTPN